MTDQLPPSKAHSSGDALVYRRAATAAVAGLAIQLGLLASVGLTSLWGDAESLYDVLENEVVPLFYDRDVDGLSRGWIAFMKNSISSLAWRFSSHRMVMDYVKSAYLTAAGGVSCDMSVR